MWNHSQMPFPGRRQGAGDEGLCLLQLWKSHYSPSSRAAETSPKTGELIGFFGIYWLTASFARKTNVPDGKRPSLAKNKSLLGGYGPRVAEGGGGQDFFVVRKKLPQSLSPHLQVVFTGFSSLTAEQNLTCWLYFDAAGNCEKLLLENYLTMVANLIGGLQHWSVGLSG